MASLLNLRSIKSTIQEKALNTWIGNYLLKPIDKDQLQSAVEKFKKYFGVKNTAVDEQFKSLLENKQNKKKSTTSKNRMIQQKHRTKPTSENNRKKK